jgi:hypothetical protein
MFQQLFKKERTTGTRCATRTYGMKNETEKIFKILALYYLSVVLV